MTLIVAPGKEFAKTETRSFAYSVSESGVLSVTESCDVLRECWEREACKDSS